MYTYNASVVRVVDGDTIQLNIDLGFKMFYKTNCRLNGLNASELNSKDVDERISALASKSFLESQLPQGETIKIVSKSLDKYGRALVEIYKGDVNINEVMLDLGHAKPYNV